MMIPKGKPCNHLGCLNHVTHPCEGCGRIAGVYIEIPLSYLKHMPYHIEFLYWNSFFEKWICVSYAGMTNEGIQVERNSVVHFLTNMDTTIHIDYKEYEKYCIEKIKDIFYHRIVSIKKYYGSVEVTIDDGKFTKVAVDIDPWPQLDHLESYELKQEDL